MILRRSVLAFVVSSLCAHGALAEPTRFYNLEGFGNWLDGNPETTAVTEDGEIILGTPARERFADAAATFGAATVLGDDIVVSRNDDGRVLAIDRAGKTRELYHVEDQMVTALAADGDALLIASGPPAKIVRLEKNGRSKTLHTPDAAFVWDLAVAADGTVYAVTGDPGTVVAIESKGGDSKGAAKVVFTPEQDHLRCLAVDKNLGIFVGGGERGILYRRAPKQDTFRALFDSGHPEITGILIDDGFAYVAAVTGAAALAAEEGNEQQGGKSKGPEVRSQLARVAMDGTAEVLAGSSDEAIFDVAKDDKGFIVVATGATGRDDPRGRLYTIEPKQRQIAMTYQSPSRRITHLLPLPRGAMGAVAAGGGRVIHLAGGLADKGEFFTTPFDAVINSSFGVVQVFADTPKGTKVTAAVRTGQTAIPDDTWTAWSREITAPGNSRSDIEHGRYLQVRLTLAGDGKATPRVSRVRVAFRRQNLRPFVREVVALKKGLALLPVMREEPKSKSVNLGDKASEDQRRKDRPDKGQERARQIEEMGALTVKWVAEDPNGDELRYDLLVRGSGADWRKVEVDLDQPFYTLQSSQLPDGHYQFRVRASDAPSNPAGDEQFDTRESQSVLIDNTPPSIDPLEVTLKGRFVSIRTVVADAVGPLLDAEVAVDGNPFRMVSPDDGVLDGPGESFTMRLGELEPGSHTVTFRVSDEGDNVGVGTARFDVP